MKISELIKELQEHLEELGDLDTYVTDNYSGFKPVTFITHRVITWDNCNPLQLGVVIEN